MDTVSVTIASAGLYPGVAPLGTSLTDDLAAQLAAVGRDPTVATDADLAGQVAAGRDFWMLTPHGMDPGYARFPDGLDPTELLAQRGPARAHRRGGKRPARVQVPGVTSFSTNGSTTSPASSPAWPLCESSRPSPAAPGQRGSPRSGPAFSSPSCRPRRDLGEAIKS